MEDMEALCRELLDELYARAFLGMAIELSDEGEICNATAEELECLAWRYGLW